MPIDDIELATMAEMLAKSSDYRVLRRLVPRTTFIPSEGQTTRIGILLDVETTGLNPIQDEIIELAMIKFGYLPDDTIANITDVFSSLNEPSIPIPAEITGITGITDEMTSGHRIDPAEVEQRLNTPLSLRHSHTASPSIRRNWTISMKRDC